MRDAALQRITESGSFDWPWAAMAGLAIVTGASGGDGGGLDAGRPASGKNGKGCDYGSGGGGGRGAVAPSADNRPVSNGGNGGKGFPGETRIVELQGLSQGDRFEIEIGQGGGGTGGEGFEKGDAGVAGADGFVLFVPLHVDKEIG